MNEPVKQLNIRLPGQVHRQMKAKCALEGLTLAESIEELVHAYLAGKIKLAGKKAKSGL